MADVKKKLPEAEVTALLMCHAALSMAASHGEFGVGSPVKACAQVLTLLAEGDDEAALERLTAYVQRRRGPGLVGAVKVEGKGSQA